MTQGFDIELNVDFDIAILMTKLDSLNHWKYASQPIIVRWDVSWFTIERCPLLANILFPLSIAILLLCSLPPTSIFCFMFCVCLGTCRDLKQKYPPIKTKKTKPFSWKKRCVQILKSSRQITMTVRGPASLHGFEPPASASDIFKSSPMTGALLSPPSRQTCSWMDRAGRPASPPYDFEGRRSERRERWVVPSSY